MLGKRWKTRDSWRFPGGCSATARPLRRSTTKKRPARFVSLTGLDPTHDASISRVPPTYSIQVERDEERHKTSPRSRACGTAVTVSNSGEKINNYLNIQRIAVSSQHTTTPRRTSLMRCTHRPNKMPDRDRLSSDQGRWTCRQDAKITAVLRDFGKVGTQWDLIDDTCSERFAFLDTSTGSVGWELLFSVETKLERNSSA
jgi:hypothetical protein